MPALTGVGTPQPPPPSDPLDPAAVNPARVRASSAYQRQRLWCGVLGIGAVLVTLWAALFFHLPAHFGAWFGNLHPALGGGLAMLLTTLVVIAVQLPFDYMGGRIIEGNFRQIDVNADYDYGQQYLRRLVGWGLSLTLAGTVVGWVWSLAPAAWPVLAGFAVMAIACVQWALPLPPSSRAKTGSKNRLWGDQVKAELQKKGLALPRMSFYEHGERSLAGGWAGAGSLKTLWVARTLWDVEPRIAAMLIAREIAHDREGHRLLSLMGTAVWTVGGFIVAALVCSRTGWGSTAPGAVFTTAAVMSTWCWLSLLCVWPAVGRWMILTADRAMLDAGWTVPEALEALDLLAERNRPDEDLPGWVAYVFHPIPPMRVRRVELLAAGQLTTQSGGH